jgi:pre-rRNA-processing protein TSR3
MPLAKQKALQSELNRLPLVRMPLSVLIIVRRGENRAQCTIQHLRGTPGIAFLRYPFYQKPDLSRYFLLAPDAPPLVRADAGRPLLLLDANWHRALKMRRAIEPIEARAIPHGWRTAYPRRSKVHTDPDTGLATIEALFAAACVLGCRDESLLRSYPWRNNFLALNRDLADPTSSGVRGGGDERKGK